MWALGNTVSDSRVLLGAQEGRQIELISEEKDKGRKRAFVRLRVVLEYRKAVNGCF